MRTRRRLMLAGLALLAAAGLGGCAQREAGGGAKAAAGNLAGRRVVMIVAQRDFRDEELEEPKAILEAHGAEVTVAAPSTQPAKGLLGMTVVPDTTLDQVRASDYDAIVFPGGSGAVEYWQDLRALGLAQEAVAEHKVVAGISLGPVTLAQAGVLKLKRATVWPTGVAAIRKRGAVYTGADVQTDGKIITANGPKAARPFGQAIAAALAR